MNENAIQVNLTPSWLYFVVEKIMIKNTSLGQKLKQKIVTGTVCNVKICLQPGLEAQKVEKHWIRRC
jgi:hypothetical protein